MFQLVHKATCRAGGAANLAQIHCGQLEDAGFLSQLWLPVVSVLLLLGV